MKSCPGWQRSCHRVRHQCTQNAFDRINPPPLLTCDLQVRTGGGAYDGAWEHQCVFQL